MLDGSVYPMSHLCVVLHFLVFGKAIQCTFYYENNQQTVIGRFWNVFIQEKLDWVLFL